MEEKHWEGVLASPTPTNSFGCTDGHSALRPEARSEENECILPCEGRQIYRICDEGVEGSEGHSAMPRPGSPANGWAEEVAEAWERSFS